LNLQNRVCSAVVWRECGCLEERTCENSVMTFPINRRIYTFWEMWWQPFIWERLGSELWPMRVINQWYLLIGGASIPCAEILSWYQKGAEMRDQVGSTCLKMSSTGMWKKLSIIVKILWNQNKKELELSALYDKSSNLYL